MRPVPVLLTLGGVLAVTAIAIATIFDGDASPTSVRDGLRISPSPTPFCTVVPGEPGIVCPDLKEPVCLPTTEHITFLNELVLPRALPSGLAFREGCLTPCDPGVACNEPAEIKYASDDGGAHFQVSTATGFPVEPRGREALQLGAIPGYITRAQRADGSTVYGVEFELRRRAYTVIAFLGPENRLTEADLNAVARYGDAGLTGSQGLN